MNSTKLQASGRRPAAGIRQKQRLMLPCIPKLTVAMTPEEHLLSASLARVIAIPGQILTKQDVLRIGLANLGVLHKAKLAVGTDLKR